MLNSVVLFTIFSFLAFTLMSTWKIGKDYNISFDSEDASGVFTSFSGTIIFDQKDLKNSKFDVSIPVKSIDTDSGLKNSHAKGEKWFDEEKYPEITYKSTKVDKTATGFVVRGNLTIKGSTKPVTIPFKFNNQGNKGLFEGNFQVNRMDFNIGKEGSVEDIIKIKVSVPVTK